MYKVIVSQKKLNSELLKRVVFKMNPKPFHVDINMKH